MKSKLSRLIIAATTVLWIGGAALAYQSGTGSMADPAYMEPEASAAAPEFLSAAPLPVMVAPELPATPLAPVDSSGYTAEENEAALLTIQSYQMGLDSARQERYAAMEGGEYDQQVKDIYLPKLQSSYENNNLQLQNLIDTYYPQILLPDHLEEGAEIYSNGLVELESISEQAYAAQQNKSLNQQTFVFVDSCKQQLQMRHDTYMNEISGLNEGVSSTYLPLLSDTLSKYTINLQELQDNYYETIELQNHRQEAEDIFNSGMAGLESVYLQALAAAEESGNTNVQLNVEGNGSVQLTVIEVTGGPGENYVATTGTPVNVALTGGQTAQLTMMPEGEATLMDLTINGNSVIGDVNDNTYYIQDLSSNELIVWATFSSTAATHNIVVMASGEGQVTENNSGASVRQGEMPFTVEDGADISFTITPDDGYHVQQAIAGDSLDVTVEAQNGGYTFTNVRGEDRLQVYFTRNTYPLTVVNIGSGTTQIQVQEDTGARELVVEGDANVTFQDEEAIPQNAPLYFTFTPSDGYQLTGLMVDTVNVFSQVEDNSYSIPAYSYDMTVTVTYEPISAVSHTLTVSAGNHGSIVYVNSNGDSITVQGQQSFEVQEGTRVPLRFVPDEGYYTANAAVENDSLGHADITAFLDADGNYAIETFSQPTTVSATFYYEWTETQKEQLAARRASLNGRMTETNELLANEAYRWNKTQLQNTLDSLTATVSDLLEVVDADGNVVDPENFDAGTAEAVMNNTVEADTTLFLANRNYVETNQPYTRLYNAINEAIVVLNDSNYALHDRTELEASLAVAQQLMANATETPQPDDFTSAADQLTLAITNFEQAPDIHTYTVKFVNGRAWTQVYAYTWSSGDTLTESSGSWPGTQLTEKSDTIIEGHSYELYTYQLTAAEAPANIIFSDGTGGEVDVTQTEDLTFSDGTTYTTSLLQEYVMSFVNAPGWDQVYAYTWRYKTSGDATPVEEYSGAFPGVALTEQTDTVINDTSYKKYTYRLTGYEMPAYIIFSDGQTGGMHHQTPDEVFVNGGEVVAYEFTITSEGNGTVTLNDTEIITAEGGSVGYISDAGATFELKFTPFDDYVIDSLSVNGIDRMADLTPDATMANAQTLTISSISDNQHVFVHFAQQLQQYTLTIQATEFGRVIYFAEAGDSIVVSQGIQEISVTEGTAVNLQIIPNEGYHIGEATMNNESFIEQIDSQGYFTLPTITDNVYISVSFAQTTHPLTVATTGNGLATVISHYNGTYQTELRNQTETFTVEDGSTATISVQPDAYNHILSILVNGTPVSLTDSIANGDLYHWSGNVLTLSNITDSIGVEVSFAQSNAAIVLTSEGPGAVYLGGEVLLAEAGTTETAVIAGSEVQLTFAPAEHYYIDSLSVNSVDRLAELQAADPEQTGISGQVLNLTVEEAAQLYVRFAPVMRTLTLTATEHGRIAYADTIQVTGGEQQFMVADGSVVSLTITPDAGYHLGGVTHNGEDVTAQVSTDGAYTFNINEDVTVAAVFGQTFHTLSITTTGNGAANYLGTDVRNTTSNFQVEEGSTAGIAVVADQYNHVESVTVNGVAAQLVNDSLFVTITDSTGVEIVFAQGATTLAITSEGNGTVSVDGTQVLGEAGTYNADVTAGSEIMLTFSPADHYQIDSLSVNGEDRLANLSQSTDVTGGYQLPVSVVEATLVYVRFAPVMRTLTLTATEHGRIAYADTIQVTGGEQQFMVADGSVVSLTITPDAGYHLGGVTHNGEDVTAQVSTDGAYTFNINEDVTVAAVFGQTFHTLAITTTGNGAATYLGTDVRNTTSNFQVEEGSTAGIAVVADQYNHVESVTVNGVAAQLVNDSLFVTITDSTGVEIVFAQSATPLAITSEGNGTVSVDGTQVLGEAGTYNADVTAGSEIMLTFSPADHYQIDSLSVNGEDRLANLSQSTDVTGGYQLPVSVVEATLVYVRFAPVMRTLTLSATEHGRIAYADTIQVTGGEQQFMVADGSVVSLTITPDAGYHLGGVTHNGEDVTAQVSTDGAYTFNINEDVTVAAVFGQTFHPLSITTTGNGAANYLGTDVRNTTSNFQVEEGSTAVITLQPDEFNHVESITVNGVAITQSNGTQIAMLVPDDYIESNDEKKAVDWFLHNYVDTGKGVLLTPATIDSLNIGKQSACWVMCDRIGIEHGWQNLPGRLSNNEVINALKNFTAGGGNLFLTNHATQLTVGVGRIAEAYAPGIFGNGDGGQNPDVWGSQPVIGNAEGQVYDHSSHEIYSGMTFVSGLYERPIYTFIGAGVKGDHNCMWDLNAYGFASNPNVVKTWEDVTNSTVLGTWNHVMDYCCAGIVDFAPTTTFAGRILAVGLAAYEWDINGTNDYQDQLEMFTSNSLSYLAYSAGEATVNVVWAGDKLSIANISEATDVNITFAQSATMLAITSEGNGTVSVDGTQVLGEAGTYNAEVTAGSNIMLTFNPADHYQIDSLSVNGEDRMANLYQSTDVAGGYQLSVSVLEATQVYVRFSPVMHTLTLNATANGGISYRTEDGRNVTVTNGEQQYSVTEGSTVSLRITPYTGYHLGAVTNNGENVTSQLDSLGNYSFTVVGDATVAAVFGQTFHELAITAQGNGAATYLGTDVRNTTTTFEVEEGGQAVITLQADEYSYVESVTVNGTAVTQSTDSVSTGGTDIEWTGETLTISQVAEAYNVEVVFARSDVELTVTAEGNGTVTVGDLSVNNASETVVLRADTAITVIMRPDDHHAIDSLSVNGEDRLPYIVTNDETGEYSLNLTVAEATLLYVRFAPVMHTLTLSATANGGISYRTEDGRNVTVTNGEQQYSVTEGSTVSLRITPYTGYHLGAVTNNGENVTSQLDTLGNYSFTVVGDVTVAAVFGQTFHELAITAQGNGAATYLGTDVRNTTATFEVEEGGQAVITLQADEYNHVESVEVNGVAVNRNAAVSEEEPVVWTDDQLTIRDITEATSVLVVFSQDIFDLTLTAEGGGTLLADTMAVRRGTRVIEATAGWQPVLRVVPEDNYAVETFTVNGTDRMADLAEDSEQGGYSLTLGAITEATTVYVSFAENTFSYEQFTVDGVTYHLNSQSLSETVVAVIDVEPASVVTIPPFVNYDSREWTVGLVDQEALRRCTGVKAIDWQVELPCLLPASTDIRHTNMLVYVQADNFAPADVNNVVVADRAKTIVLDETDAAGFYAPRPFTAQQISYSHTYSLETPIGGIQGWETLALPFTVQTITHETQGEIAPFAALDNDQSGRKPFWLYGCAEAGGFVRAAQIEANKPYVIAMPNNRYYSSEYILAGRVTFSATNVEVPVTEALTGNITGQYQLTSAFTSLSADDANYVLNIGGEAELLPGSAFVRGVRDVAPFQAYVTSGTAGAPAVLPMDMLFDESTGIADIFANDLRRVAGLYDLGGRKLSDDSRLRKGIYVREGKKQVVK